jgi:hypothetical protein
MANQFFSESLYGNYTSGSMSLGDYKRQMDDESVQTPDYNRNFVWTPNLKQRYLETLSKRGPIFGFVFNLNDDDGVYEMIDGQNRGKSIYEFMTDRLIYNRPLEEGGGLKYSEITGQERRLFDRMEIHFIKTINWNEDDCQEYFRSIQDGMKLTKGEEIHSAQNNIFQMKIVHLINRYNEILKKPKKDGGMNYTDKRYKNFEVIGGLLVMLRDGEYMDRAGQVAYKELKLWDNVDGNNLSPADITRLRDLDEAVQLFESTMEYMITLRDRCPTLNNIAYSRDSTFIRNMWFIKLFRDEMEPAGSENEFLKFDGMMQVVLKKKTALHDKIKVWGGYGGMADIMGAYKDVYDSL